MSDAAAQTGVVIVALPAADDPVQLIGLEQKHATLLYFGDVEGGDNPNDLLTDDAKALMVQTLTVVAGGWAPFAEQVTAVESLGDQGARVWMLEGAGLPDLRAAILDADDELGPVLGGVEQYPSYTPHVTIGYPMTAADDPDGQTPGDELSPDGVELSAVTEAAAADVESITFDRLGLWWAGEQTEYPLTGADPDQGVAEHFRPGGLNMPQPRPVHEQGRILEATRGSDRRPIQIITPGWGSSGYYSPQVLEQAAADRVIPAGTHMYLNHATEAERQDRPERDVEKIAAVLAEDARWDGTRLIADAQLIGPHAELIEALAPYIGVSISGSATDVAMGEAEGRKGPIIEGLAAVSSVDFVTRAGRGGMVLLESARPSLVNAAAVAHGVAESTVNDTREQLATLLRDAHASSKKGTYVWVKDFDDATVWFEVETDGGDGNGTYAQAYTVGEDGAVALSGSRTEVRVVTTYVPVTTAESSTTEATSEPLQAAEAATETSDPPSAEPPATGQPVAESTHTPSPIQEDTMTDTTQGAGGTAPASPPRNPREVMEAQMREQGRQIALLRAGQLARGIVTEVLAAGWIGEAQTIRLTNELTAEASLPLTEDGVLDEATLRARALARLDEAESEAAEILASAGVGSVRGLGSTGRATEVAIHAYEADLGESMGVFGLSESAVTTAVKGR